MDNNQKWISEVMSQNVDASIGQDYTRLALNFVFIKDNIFENKIYLKGRNILMRSLSSYLVIMFMCQYFLISSPKK